MARASGGGRALNWLSSPRLPASPRLHQNPVSKSKTSRGTHAAFGSELTVCSYSGSYLASRWAVIDGEYATWNGVKAGLHSISGTPTRPRLGRVRNFGTRSAPIRARRSLAWCFGSSGPATSC